MNIETILKLFSSDTVSGLLAIGGIVALVTSIVGYLKPPDDLLLRRPT